MELEVAVDVPSVAAVEVEVEVAADPAAVDFDELSLPQPPSKKTAVRLVETTNAVIPVRTGVGVG